jgi:hypothetical protein
MLTVSRLSLSGSLPHRDYVPCARCPSLQRPASSGRHLYHIYALPSSNAPSELDDLVDRAESALERAREALSSVQRDAAQNSNTNAPPFIPSTLTFGTPLSEQKPRSSTKSADEPIHSTRSSDQSTRSVSTSSDRQERPDLHSLASSRQTSSRPASESHWSEKLEEAPTMILQRQPIFRQGKGPSLDFMEPHEVQELIIGVDVRYFITLQTPCLPPPGIVITYL